MLPEGGNRLAHFGRSQRLQCPGSLVKGLARMHDRHCSSAVAPDGREQREPVTAAHSEIALQNRPSFPFRQQALYPVVDHVTPERPASDGQRNRQAQRADAPLRDVLRAVIQPRDSPTGHREVGDDPAV